VQKVHSIHPTALDGVNDEAQVGASYGFIRPRDDEERARRALCAASAVATRVGARLKASHQYVFQGVSCGSRVTDGRHDAVKHFWPWQRVPLHENVQCFPISVIAGSAVARELDDVSLDCGNCVLANRKLRIQRWITEYAPNRVCRSTLTEEPYAGLDGRHMAAGLRDEHALSRQQAHDAVDITSARSARDPNALGRGIEYNDGPRRGCARWEEGYRQHGAQNGSTTE
jgi:hypothetical protein